MKEEALLSNTLQHLQYDEEKNIILIYFNSNNLYKNNSGNEFINILYENFHKVGIKPYYISFFSPEKHEGEKERSMQERDEKLWQKYVETKPRIVNLSINPEFLEYYYKGFFCNGQEEILDTDQSRKYELEYNDPKYNYNTKDAKSVNFYKEWLEKIIEKNLKSQIIIVEKAKHISPFLENVAINNLKNENLYLFSSEGKKSNPEQNYLKTAIKTDDALIKSEKKLNTNRKTIINLNNALVGHCTQNILFDKNALNENENNPLVENKNTLKFIKQEDMYKNYINFLIKHISNKVENKNLNLLTLPEESFKKPQTKKTKDNSFEQKLKTECSIV